MLTPCIESPLRSRTHGGHVRVQRSGKFFLAHRLAWEQANGPIPAGLHVLHKCDNPPCINVEHLFLGTHTDNMQDMAAKGRNHAPVGDDHHNTKLGAQAVAEIRRRLDAPYHGIVKSLATEFNCTPQNISLIRHNKSRMEDGLAGAGSRPTDRREAESNVLQQ